MGEGGRHAVEVCLRLCASTGVEYSLAIIRQLPMFAGKRKLDSKPDSTCGVCVDCVCVCARVCILA